jgi:hypothetical protein
MLNLLFALFVSVSVDCRPQVSVVCQSAGVNRNCSGTVYSETDTHYYVISCAHFIDIENEESCNYTVTLYNDQLSPTVEAEMISYSEYHDLSVLRIKKFPQIKVRPLKIADSKLPQGTECIGYGYTPDYQKRPLAVSSYTEYNAGDNNPLLHCRGSVISGMSGGPLIYQNQIFGVLSTSQGDTEGALYVPSSVINEFLETL